MSDKKKNADRFNYWRKNQPERFKGTILDFSVAKNIKNDEDSLTYVVDAVMGSGKTTAAINFINDLPRNVKVIYITPYLDEIQRIIKSCPDKKFVEPKEKVNKVSGAPYKGKMADFVEKVEKGNNIVCTHALFHNLSPENIQSIKSNNYILIMDEVADVIEQLPITKKDIKIILQTEKLAEMDPNTREIKWKDWSYRGVFEPYMNLSRLGCLFGYGNIKEDEEDEIEDIELLEDNGEEENVEQNVCPSLLMWNYPITIYKAFKKVFILTYMFEGQVQCGYLRYHKMGYKYIHVEKNEIETKDGTKTDYNFLPNIFEEPQVFDTSYYQNLIHIEEGNSKVNMIGYKFDKYDKTVPLSKNWYRKCGHLHKTLKNNTVNFFKNLTSFEPSSKYRMWTTFKDYRNVIKGDGYAREFIPLNSRATNKYKDKYILAYLVNRYPLLPVNNFLKQKGIKIDQDQFALSEMLQWIFRSRIRDEKEIWIYIPSLRMRNLLKIWMGLEPESEW